MQTGRRSARAVQGRAGTGNVAVCINAAKQSVQAAANEQNVISKQLSVIHRMIRVTENSRN